MAQLLIGKPDRDVGNWTYMCTSEMLQLARVLWIEIEIEISYTQYARLQVELLFSEVFRRITADVLIKRCLIGNRNLLPCVADNDTVVINNPLGVYHLAYIKHAQMGMTNVTLSSQHRTSVKK